MIAFGCASLAGSNLAWGCDQSKSTKKEIRSDKAPKAIGPYSQAIEANGIIFASGQIAIDPASGKLLEGPVTEQAHLVLNNLKAVMEAAGCTLDNVVKCTVFLQDMNDYAAVNKIYGQFFKAPFPARAAVEVARLPKDVKIEIEAIAVK